MSTAVSFITTTSLRPNLQTLNMAMLPLKCSVICFLGAKGLSANAIHIHHTVQNWPPVTITFLGQ